jgi:hypothetical protein
MRLWYCGCWLSHLQQQFAEQQTPQQQRQSRASMGGFIRMVEHGQWNSR